MKITLLVCSFLALSVTIAQTQPINLKINQHRTQARLFELSGIGELPNGGVGRVAYGKADREGRAYFMGLMKKAGLDVTIDYAGNLVGRRKGKIQPSNPSPLAPTSTAYRTGATTMARWGPSAGWN